MRIAMAGLSVCSRTTEHTTSFRSKTMFATQVWNTPTFVTMDRFQTELSSRWSTTRFPRIATTRARRSKQGTYPISFIPAQ
jgi:hypothetical protein